MKKIIFAAVAASMLLAGLGATAQEVAVEAGYVNSVNRTKVGDAVTRNPFDGFTLGVRYGLDLGGKFTLEPGFQYEFNTDRRNYYIVLEETDTDHYINVPFHLGYKTDLTDALGLHLSVGPTFSFNVASTSKFAVLGNSLTYNNLKGEFNQSTIAPDLLNDIGKYLPYFLGHKNSVFDLMLGATAGLDLMDCIRFSVGYDFGLFNRFDYKDVDYLAQVSGLEQGRRWRNRFTVGIAYVF